MLSDAFERQSPEIKKLLESVPVPLTRRPRAPRTLSFLRAGDVISFELSGRTTPLSCARCPAPTSSP
ncbi:hypothetical protein ACFV8T_25800 [Streptomyces sp. NPDC059832]|uniref:hypothetical protein n=1 Tax=Streptomyces sp. NPDC059832 TaxID=3346966 RepID=UPI003663F5C0